MSPIECIDAMLNEDESKTYIILVLENKSLFVFQNPDFMDLDEMWVN